MAHKLPSL